MPRARFAARRRPGSIARSRVAAEIHTEKRRTPAPRRSRCREPRRAERSPDRARSYAWGRLPEDAGNSANALQGVPKRFFELKLVASAQQSRRKSEQPVDSYSFERWWLEPSARFNPIRSWCRWRTKGLA